MKLRIKLFMITMLAMLAFIGIGFASWTFKNSVETSNISVTDKVAVAVEMDETFGLHAYAEDTYTTEVTALYLICDAPTAATSDYLAGAGVYWAYDAAGEHAVTNLYLKGQLEYNAEDGVLPLTSVTVTFTITNTIALDKYVTIGTTAASADVTINPVADGAVVAYTLALPTLAYTAEVIAFDSVSDVTTMNTYLASNLTGGIQVSASISAKSPTA